MKVFIVLFALVAVAFANSVGRAGWGSGSSLPSIDLELAAAVAAAASGQASGSQALLETVSGTIDLPSSLTSLSGVQAVGLSQTEEISQVQIANKPSGATSTINAAAVENESVAIDVLEAAMSGGNSASVQNSGQTQATGEASSAADAESYNSVQSRK